MEAYMAISSGKKKEINAIRQRYTDETGNDYRHPDFLTWLTDNGFPPPPEYQHPEPLKFQVVYAEPKTISLMGLKVTYPGQDT